MPGQSYRNHARFSPPFHFVLLPVIFFGVIGSLVNLRESVGDHQRLYSASLLGTRHRRLVPGRLVCQVVRAQGAGSGNPRRREPAALRAHRQTARRATVHAPDHRPSFCGRRRVRRVGTEGRRCRACPRRRSRKPSSFGRPTTIASDRRCRQAEALATFETCSACLRPASLSRRA